MAFICSCCEYVTDNKSNYNRHCKTKIHKTNVDIEFTVEEIDIINTFLEIINRTKLVDEIKETKLVDEIKETKLVDEIKETKQNNPYGMSEEQYKEFREYLSKPLLSDKDVERKNKENAKRRKEREKKLIELENQKEERIKQLTIEQNKKWNDMYYEEVDDEE